VNHPGNEQLEENLPELWDGANSPGFLYRNCQLTRLIPEEVLRKLDEADAGTRQLWEEHQARDRAERQARGEGTSTSRVEPSVEIHHEGAAEDPTDGDEARILTAEEEDDATGEVPEILVTETTAARASSVDEPTSASREGGERVSSSTRRAHRGSRSRGKGKSKRKASSKASKVVEPEPAVGEEEATLSEQEPLAHKRRRLVKAAEKTIHREREGMPL
jgi:hypothetical protein